MTDVPTYRDRFSPLDPKLAEPDSTSTTGPSENFWSTLRAMRTECPVAHSDAHGKNGQWIVTGHQDVTTVAKDWESFTSQYGGAPVPFDDGQAEFKLRPLDLDPPEHRHLRKLLNPFFGLGAVGGREQEIRDIAVEIIEGFADKGSCEFMTSFAIPFPAQVFFRLYLGLPTSRLPEVLGWVDQIVMHPEHATEAIAQLAPYIIDIFEKRKTERRDDVLDALVHGEVDGRRMTDIERLETVFTLIIAGLETTANAIGNAVMHLAADAALRDQVIAMDDVAPACDELLRFEAPAPGLARTCTRDTQLGGQHIAAGDRVLVYFGSANRDSAVWDNPDAIDFSRPDARKHYSFGFGIHRCVGSHLAELELRIALEELLTRLPELRLDPDHHIEWRNAFSRGPAQLHVLFDAAGT